MPRPLTLIGAGGSARELLDVLHDINEELPPRSRYEVTRVLSDPPPEPRHFELYGLGGSTFGSVASLGRTDPDMGYIIAIGSPQVRSRIALAHAADRSSPTLVHPTVVMARRRIELGAGTIVMPCTSVGSNVVLGRHVLVSGYVVVGTGVRIADYVTLSPYCSLGAGVTLGSGVFVGTGAIISAGITVGPDAVIGAGAMIEHDVERGVTMVGSPARAIAPPIQRQDP